jgi:molecular chaperone DnaJ
VVLHVEEDEVFERQDTHLYCTVPVSFPQAALGAELSVPTLEGEERLKIPEGTQSGSVFRLKGKGLASLNGRGRGDQFVTVQVATPTKLNREQRKLLERLAETSQADNRPYKKRFLEELKEIFR